MILYSNDIQLRRAIHGALGECLAECLPDFIETLSRKVMASDEVAALVQTIVRDEFDLRSVSGEAPIAKIVEPSRRTPAHKAVLQLCGAYDVSLEDMSGQSRLQHLVIARQHIMYVLATVHSWTYVRISEFLGGRDVSTIRHGVARHRERSEERAEALRQNKADACLMEVSS